VEGRRAQQGRHARRAEVEGRRGPALSGRTAGDGRRAEVEGRRAEVEGRRAQDQLAGHARRAEADCRAPAPEAEDGRRAVGAARRAPVLRRAGGRPELVRKIPLKRPHKAAEPPALRRAPGAAAEFHHKAPKFRRKALVAARRAAALHRAPAVHTAPARRRAVPLRPGDRGLP
jgi:hypothetical protein